MPLKSSKRKATTAPSGDDEPPGDCEPPGESIESKRRKSHLYAMELALQSVMSSEGIRVQNALFQEHRGNSNYGKKGVFAQEITKGRVAGEASASQVLKSLLTTLTDKSSWVPDKSLGGHNDAFELIECCKANWTGKAMRLVLEQCRRGKQAMAAIRVIERMHKLVGHLTIYQFAIPDYDTDPGNGCLYITGYVAVDGRILYGWFEERIKL